MRVLLDPTQSELNAVLGQLLEEDVDITAREVARRHPTIKTVTAFTRNAERSKVILDAKQRQQAVRAVALDPHRKRAQSLSTQLERREAKLEELEKTCDALVTSHVACVRAVMRHGGMAALERFWHDYRAIGDELRSADAIPESAAVVVLEDSRKRAARALEARRLEGKPPPD